jgi:tripartite-type tricarboxylate transporter receptor subunit TctC
MKIYRRRQLLYLAAGAAALPGLSRIAGAQPYPSRPVRIVVGFAPGINPDIIARLIAQPLSERLGQQIIVENRPGAGSTIGTEAVVRAPPDGYTLLAVTSTNTVNSTLYDKLTFDFIRDIAPIAGTVRLPSIMAVTPSLPVKTVPEFIAYAKANPHKLTMASPGVGSAAHVMGELFKAMTEIDILHVPYRNTYFPDLLSGLVQMVFIPIASVLEYIRGEKLRALAVTGARRSEVLPDVPTVGEFVPGYEAYVWDGIGAPRGTPADIISRLNGAINASLTDPDMQVRFAALGAEPMIMTPAGFGKFVAGETEKWGKVVHAANMKSD